MQAILSRMKLRFERIFDDIFPNAVKGFRAAYQVIKLIRLPEMSASANLPVDLPSSVLPPCSPLSLHLTFFFKRSQNVYMIRQYDKGGNDISIAIEF